MLNCRGLVRGNPVTSRHESTGRCVLTPKHVDKDRTGTGQPVTSEPEFTGNCILTPRRVESGQTGTGQPVTERQDEELKIDFRIPGLSHSIVKEAEHLRVQELVNRIETHPHRAALHADLQQNNVYNPFSENSKKMIRELGNVELFELCETTPKVQCPHCLLYWNQGIAYCTCGQCLIFDKYRRDLNRKRLDALSIPAYVIKKSPTHGARHGKTEVQREYYLAWNAWKRCCKKVDSKGEHFTGIHDRFLRDPIYRESQLAIGWTEEDCKEWDELAQQDHSYTLIQEEYKRYNTNWYISLNSSGKNGPMKHRSDYKAAVIKKNRLHQESGETIQEFIHPGQQQRRRPGNDIFSEDYRSSARVDQHTGWSYWPSSSSWWQESDWSWK